MFKGRPKCSERASNWIYLVRLMHGEIFESHFKAKIGHQKIQILARSSHTPILRVFFEFSNLSKTPQIIFFRSNLNAGRCISTRRTVLAWFRKNPTKKFFRPLLLVPRVKMGQKSKFLRFFRNHARIVLRVEIHRPAFKFDRKNYLWCFRQVGKLKKYT